MNFVWKCKVKDILFPITISKCSDFLKWFVHLSSDIHMQPHVLQLQCDFDHDISFI